MTFRLCSVSLLQVLALLAHVLADRALHGEAVVLGAPGLQLEGGDCRRKQRVGPLVGGHGGGRLLRVHLVRGPSALGGAAAAGIRAGALGRARAGLCVDSAHNDREVRCGREVR
jgi:hypothetical protein